MVAAASGWRWSNDIPAGAAQERMFWHIVMCNGPATRRRDNARIFHLGKMIFLVERRGADYEGVMSRVRTVIPGISSAVISFFVAYFNYIGLESFPGIARLAAIVSSAFLIGMCHGFFIPSLAPSAVGVGAFFGVLILWSPVVVVTYGFALMALPLLAAFAMLVIFGAKIGASLRTNSSWKVF